MRYKPEKPIEPDRNKYVTFQHVAYIDNDFSADKKGKAAYTKQLREFNVAVKGQAQVVEARLVERERRELERLQRKYSDNL